MNEHASAWKPLIDEWVARERRLHPDAPILDTSVRVRDAVEIDDQAFVLVSYDIDYPWPKEEDAPGQSRQANTAVLQAMRVRQPWIERDATRALARMSTTDGGVVAYEHLLGRRRAYSGTVANGLDRIELGFDDGSTTEVSVVDGWFLAVVPEVRQLASVSAAGSDDDGYASEFVRDDIGEVLDDLQFARTAGRSMYFSPLDLRAVEPLVQWQRSGDLVVVAVCLERYDEGGVLRLRVDGVRGDDDLFVNWPRVSVEANGMPVATAICGEYGLADTVTMDIGFKPYLPEGTHTVIARVSGLRGPEGPIEPVTLEITVGA